jgi:hypothetical protein
MKIKVDLDLIEKFKKKIQEDFKIISTKKSIGKDKIEALKTSIVKKG